MCGAAGGSYVSSLRMTFLPQLLSMNVMTAPTERRRTGCLPPIRRYAGLHSHFRCKTSNSCHRHAVCS